MRMQQASRAARGVEAEGGAEGGGQEGRRARPLPVVNILSQILLLDSLR